MINYLKYLSNMLFRRKKNIAKVEGDGNINIQDSEKNTINVVNNVVNVHLPEGKQQAPIPKVEKKEQTPAKLIDKSDMKHVTILYDSAEDTYLNTLMKYLKRFQKRKKLTIWSNQDIRGGENIRESTEVEIRKADLVVTLLSANFLNNDSLINYIEMANRQQNTQIIPILISSCMYKYEPIFEEAKILPDNEVSVNNWSSEPDAWTNIMEGILRYI